MFYDETGKHVRTKKEILDEAGQLRSGCKIIPKGEVYERNIFTIKDSRFKGEVAAEATGSEETREQQTEPLL